MITLLNDKWSKSDHNNLNTWMTNEINIKQNKENKKTPM